MQIGSNPAPDTGRFQKRRRMYDLNINESWAFRVVNGPIASFSHMWPTMEEDRTTKVYKPTWKSVCVRRDETNILDKLAEIDSTLKKKLAEKNGQDPKQSNSTLRKGDSFNYACIFRNTSKAPAIEILEANWSVHDQLMQIRSKKDPTQKDFLMYGLLYMYDVVLEKRKDPKTGRPGYKVDVVPSTLTTPGKIHTQFLDEPKFPYPNKESFFSAEDLETIMGCPWELTDQYKPVSPDKVMETLKEFPLDLGRRMKSNPNVFMFFSGLEDLLAIQQVAKTQNIPVITPNQQDLQSLGVGAGPALTGGHPQQQALPGQQTGRGAVDAQFTVVQDQQPPVQQPPVQQPAAAPAGPYAHQPAAEKVLPFRENPAASTGSVMPPPAQPDQPFNPAPAPGPAMTPAPMQPPAGELKRPIW